MKKRTDLRRNKIQMNLTDKEIEKLEKIGGKGKSANQIAKYLVLQYLEAA